MKRFAETLVGLLLAESAAFVIPLPTMVGVTMNEDSWAGIDVTIDPASVSANTSA